MTPPESDALDLGDVLEHEEWLRPLARQLAGDDDTAEDLVQEAVITAWRRPPSDRRALPAWLKRVLSNLAKMQRRGDSRRSSRERLAARGEEASAEPSLETLEVRRSVVQALMEVDEPYRSTLVLRYYEEMSAAEIARVEDIPASTVRVRIKRGLDRMRARLEAEHGDCRLALLTLGGGTATASPGATGSRNSATTTLPSTARTRHPVAATARRGWRRAALVTMAGTIALVGWLWSSRTDSEAGRLDGGVVVLERRNERVTASQPVSRVPSITRVRAGATRAPARGEQPARSRASTVGLGSAGTVVLRVIDAATADPVVGARVETGDHHLAWNQVASGFESTFEFLLADRCPLLLGVTDERGELHVPRARLLESPLEIIASGYRSIHERPTRRPSVDTPYVVRLPRPLATIIEVRTENGARLRNAEVTVLDGTGVVASWTGSDHRHDKRREMELVRIEAEGYAASQDLLTAPIHQQTLVRGRTAIGRVVGPDGTPVVGATAEVRSDRWRGPPARHTTDTDGRFTTLMLPLEGTLRLMVRHPHYPADSRTVTLPCDDLGEIVLAPAAFLTGRVIGASGYSRGGATVIAYPADEPGHSRHMIRTSTAEDGSYRLGPLVEGNYRVRSEHPDHASAEISANPATLGTVQLSGGAPLRIRVRTESGQPASGIAVKLGTVLGDDLRGETVRTDANGVVEFAHAPTDPVRHRPRRRVLRWTALGALNQEPTRQLLVELFSPVQLLSCNGVEVPRPAHYGSRNTAAVDLSLREHELVIEDPEDHPTVGFRLVDREGGVLHAFTNVLIVSPDDWVMKDFAGLSGRPLHLPRVEVLEGAQLTVMSRGYCWQTVHVAFGERRGRIDVELTPLLERPARLRIDGGADREILLAPITAGRGPLAALPVGRCDSDGGVALTDFGPGRYFVCTPMDPCTLLRQNGKRRSALMMDEVQILGSVTLSNREGQVIPLSGTPTETENR